MNRFALICNEITKTDVRGTDDSIRTERAAAHRLRERRSTQQTGSLSSAALKLCYLVSMWQLIATS